VWQNLRTGKQRSTGQFRQFVNKMRSKWAFLSSSCGNRCAIETQRSVSGWSMFFCRACGLYAAISTPAPTWLCNQSAGRSVFRLAWQRHDFVTKTTITGFSVSPTQSARTWRVDVRSYRRDDVEYSLSYEIITSPQRNGRGREAISGPVVCRRVPNHSWISLVSATENFLID